MKRYFVKQYGFYYPNPEGITLDEARKELSKLLKEDKDRCQRRNKCGKVIRTSKDCGRVVMGNCIQSEIYSAYSIQPA